MYKIPTVLLLGYLLGCINPAWIISKFKKKELRSEGTKNLGATNVFLTIGKSIGVIVMILDITKAFAAVTIAKLLFPQFAYAGVLAGAAAMLGHMFPFSLGFKGGKGSSCLAGVVIALDVRIFFVLLLLGIALSFVINYPWALPVSAAGLFPFAYGISTQSSMNFAILLFPCMCLIFKHTENFRRALAGTEQTVSGYLKRSNHEKL